MSTAATVLPAETVRRALTHVGLYTGRAGERTLEAAEEFLRARGYAGTVRQQPDGSIAFVGDAQPAAEFVVELAQLARQGQYGGAAASSPRVGRPAPAPRVAGLGDASSGVRWGLWAAGIGGALFVGWLGYRAYTERRDKKLLGVEGA